MHLLTNAFQENATVRNAGGNKDNERKSLFDFSALNNKITEPALIEL